GMMCSLKHTSDVLRSVLSLTVPLYLLSNHSLATSLKVSLLVLFFFFFFFLLNSVSNRVSLFSDCCFVLLRLPSSSRRRDTFTSLPVNSSTPKYNRNSQYNLSSFLFLNLLKLANRIYPFFIRRARLLTYVCYYP